MIATIAAALVVGYLPGLAIFRLPVLDRRRRAGLDAAERAFWAVALSMALSLVVTLVLAAFRHYTFHHLVGVNLLLTGIAIGAGRRAMIRIDGAARPDAWLAVPVGLVILALWINCTWVSFNSR